MKKYTLLILTILQSVAILAQTNIGYIPITDPAYKIPFTATIAGTPGSLPAWYINLQKYWYYRYKLVNDFMLIGPSEGQSIPAQKRNLADMYTSNSWPLAGSANMIEWQDATIDLGHYLATLALEYKILGDNSWDVSRTYTELQYAQNAIDRLRLHSAIYYGDPTAYPGNPSLRGYHTTSLISGCTVGFFIRDDVPFIDFIDPVTNKQNWLHFNRIGINPSRSQVDMKAVNNIYGCFTSSYGGSTGAPDPRGGTYLDPNVKDRRIPDVPDCESQDQLADIFSGEAMVSKYVSGTAVQADAQDAIYYLIDWPSHLGPYRPYVSIPSPTNPYHCAKDDCFKTGLIACSAPPATNAAFLYGSNRSAMKDDEVLASAQVPLFEVGQFLHVGIKEPLKDLEFQDFYAAIAKDYVHYIPGDAILNYLAFMAKKPNTTWTTINTHSNDANFCAPQLPLTYELFQHENHSWTGHTTIRNMLDIAPPCGPYNYSYSASKTYGGTPLYKITSDKDGYEGDFYNTSGQAWSSIEWSGNDRLSEPYHRSGYSDYFPNKDDGEYNGLDYMELFNLFSLQQSTTSTPYLGGMMNSYYCTNYNVDYPDAISYGEESNKLRLNWLEYVSAANHVKYSSTSGSNGWLDFRGGKCIDLIPGGIHGGFLVDKGAFFQAYIKDYNCNGGDAGDGPYNFAEISPAAPYMILHKPDSSTNISKTIPEKFIPVAYLPKGAGFVSERAPDVDPAEDEAIAAMFTQSFKDSMLNAYKHYFANHADADQLDFLQNMFGWTKDSLDKYKDENYADTSLVTLYPNPAHDISTLEYTVTAAQHVYIMFTNTMGQKMNNILDNYSENASPGTYRVTLHTARLTPGIYYCTIYLNGNIICKKLVVD